MTGKPPRPGRRAAPPPPAPAGDEAGLWERVKRSVTPLDAARRDRYAQALDEILARTPAGEPAPAPPAQRRRAKAPPSLPPPAPPPPPAVPPLVALDRRTRTRIARGRTAIDARLDLHGLRQNEAHEVLRSFIWRCHARGLRTVLVITGKGSRAREPHPEAPPWAVGAGILRRAVPQWLEHPDLRGAVLGIEPAHASHGGEGALYVRLRARPDAVPDGRP